MYGGKDTRDAARALRTQGFQKDGSGLTLGKGGITRRTKMSPLVGPENDGDGQRGRREEPGRRGGHGQTSILEKKGGKSEYRVETGDVRRE